MARAYLGFGSNLGDRQENIQSAVRLLKEREAIDSCRLSSFYETKPVGVEDQPDFINAVGEVDTSLSPDDLLQAALDTERELGRVRTIRWGPRTIDIDILLYDGVEVHKPGLVIPHPEMMNRLFVLEPLAELAPDLALPGGRTARESARRLLEDPVSSHREEENQGKSCT